MGFVAGHGRTQGSLFPVTLEELIPDDHVCRVIDAFVARVEMAAFGFERAVAAEAGGWAHLAARVAAALMTKPSELLATPLAIEKIDVLAAQASRVTLGTSVGIRIEQDGRMDNLFITWVPCALPSDLRI